jgi:hypothetical protein
MEFATCHPCFWNSVLWVIGEVEWGNIYVNHTVKPKSNGTKLSLFILKFLFEMTLVYDHGFLV